MKCPNCNQHTLAEISGLHKCPECGYFKANDDGTMSPTDERPPVPDDPTEPVEDPKDEPTPEPNEPKDDPQDEPFLGIKPFDLEDI